MFPFMLGYVFYTRVSNCLCFYISFPFGLTSNCIYCCLETCILQSLQKDIYYSGYSGGYGDHGYHHGSHHGYHGRSYHSSYYSRSYLEVIVGTQPVGFPVAVATATAVSTPSPSLFNELQGKTSEPDIEMPPPVAPGAYSSGKSVATRLQELEGIKSLLSVDEYNQKRQAILSDV